MNKRCFGIALAAAVGSAAILSGCKPAAPSAAPESKPDEAKEASFVQHGTNGETFVKIDAGTQARMGLKTATLAAAELPNEIKGFGRVLDPTPLVSLTAEMASAKAALEASTKEYDRLKTLHDESQNISTRALEAADSAMKKDRVALDSIEPRLLLAFGKSVASLPDLPALANSLASGQEALVRVDLPAGEGLKVQPTGARIGSLTAPEKLSPAEFISRAPSADPQIQGEGFLFLQKENPLPIDTAIIAWLAIGGAMQKGVVVPREALLRHEGQVFVYIQTGDSTFQRKLVELDRPLDAGWFVRRILSPEDKVVVTGAQQLLSEESRASSSIEE